MKNTKRALRLLDEANRLATPRMDAELPSTGTSILLIMAVSHLECQTKPPSCARLNHKTACLPASDYVPLPQRRRRSREVKLVAILRHDGIPAELRLDTLSSASLAAPENTPGFAIDTPWVSRPTVMPIAPARRFSRKIASKIILLAGLVMAFAASAADTLDLTHYRGKVVLVDFWASWCVPCRRSFPWLNEMQERYGDRGLIVVGVNVDANRSAAEGFLREVPAQFQIIYDPAGELAAAYRVPGMPTSFLFGPDGSLVSNHIGFQQTARDEREAELQRLLPVPPVRTATP